MAAKRGDSSLIRTWTVGDSTGPPKVEEIELTTAERLTRLVMGPDLHVVTCTTPTELADEVVPRFEEVVASVSAVER